MDFAQALVAVKEGKRIGRLGWNGKGMFVYYVPGGEYPTQTEVAKKQFGASIQYNPYLAIKTTTESVSTWVPSINDCLAEDWEILN